MSNEPRMVWVRPYVDPRDDDGRVWGDALADTCKFVVGVFRREKQRRNAKDRREWEQHSAGPLSALLKMQAD